MITPFSYLSPEEKQENIKKRNCRVARISMGRFCKTPCSPPYALFTGSMYESGNTNTTPGRSVNKPKQVRNLVKIASSKGKEKTRLSEVHTLELFGLLFSHDSLKPLVCCCATGIHLRLGLFQTDSTTNTQRKTKKKKRKKSKCKLMSCLASNEKHQ